MTDLLFLPIPQELNLTGTVFSLPEEGLITLDGPVTELWFTAVWLQEALLENAQVEYELVGGTAVPEDQVVFKLSIKPGSVAHEQGYTITVADGRVEAMANAPVGLFYAVQTLTQLLEQTGADLPELACHDWPDFPNRGVMLDISRDKVPTMETLYDLIDMLASWKINQFQLYTEHTFAYRHHPVVWQNASPITAEEIMDLDRYCRDRFIDLVPNQNTFGHMRRWFIHEEYAHLAESLTGAQTPWGYFDPEPFSLSPAVPESLELVRGLFDELLPNFSSQQINVGCDETYDIGQGLSKDLVAEKGNGRVYLDYLLEIYQEVKKRGYTMQFWGDIIIEHPDLVKELPKDAIAMEWGYEANHPFAQHGQIFADSGVPFYVCTGTSSWNTIAGRTNNAIGNIKNGASNGRKYGAVGLLNTEWGDNGHWQPLPVSFLGFAVGAAFSWAEEANQNLDVPSVLNRFAFRDEAGLMGQLVYDLGNVYEHTHMPAFNGTCYAYSMIFDLANFVSNENAQKIENLQETITAVDNLLAQLPQTNMQRDDALLLQREFIWAGNMAKHGCRRLIWALGKHIGPEDSNLRRELAAEIEQLMAEYERIWHGRNRPGGFNDSVARMQKMAQIYKE